MSAGVPRSSQVAAPRAVAAAALPRTLAAPRLSRHTCVSPRGLGNARLSRGVAWKKGKDSEAPQSATLQSAGITWHLLHSHASWKHPQLTWKSCLFFLLFLLFSKSGRTCNKVTMVLNIAKIVFYLAFFSVIISPRLVFRTMFCVDGRWWKGDSFLKFFCSLHILFSQIIWSQHEVLL